MKLEKTFDRTHFSEAAIRAAAAAFDRQFMTFPGASVGCRMLSAGQGNETWDFDKDDDFFAAYPNAENSTYRRVVFGGNISEVVGGAVLHLNFSNETTLASVEIKLPDQPNQRASIKKVMSVLDKYEEQCRTPGDSNSGPSVFIGHGRSPIWRDLKDHLADKHGYTVESYDSGARAGHAIRDILQRMLDRSSFALLILTKEDETSQGNQRPRQNVVHETGLFQGKLGFSRAIVLLENGTEDFSNIGGIAQIRFTKIEETFGEVLATLRREFGPV